MKIILDTDGTLTDFNQFVLEHALPYFEKNYGFTVVYPDKLEIEDILDIKNRLVEKGLTVEQAEQEMKKMLDKFWISLRFVKFSLLTKFRPGVEENINKFIKEGHDVQVHTSRAKTIDKGIIGDIARKFTIWQYYMNGIRLPKNKFYFYPNDEEKIKGIINAKPQIAFDDKPEIIKVLNESNIKTICIAGSHNQMVESSNNNEKITEFSSTILNDKLSKLFGKQLELYNREVSYYKFYQKIRLSIPLILKTFNPIILNSENLIKTNDDAIIYAPNHRSTLDPLVINACIDEYIHWAALKRFFDGQDSIFNNSKNKILCDITSNCFKNLGYFPIDRVCDNPSANNFESIKEMNNFLKIKSKIGIFPEGTTKRPENRDFGTFDESFLTLASRTGAIVQPITTLWIKELNCQHKLIINFGPSFKVTKKEIENAYHNYLQIQEELLGENKLVRENLIEEFKLSKKISKII